MWISNLLSPPPSSPLSREKLNLVNPPWRCFTSCLDQENSEKPLGRDIQIFENSQTTRYSIVFGIQGVRAPKARRQQVQANVQHVLVECPGLAQLRKALQLRAQVSGAVSLYSGSGEQLAAEFQAVFRRLGLVNSSSHLQVSEVAVPLTTFSVVATFRLCVDRRDGLQRKLQRGTSGKQCSSWRACPFQRAQQIWWLNSPTWRRRCSTKLQRLHLPASHPNTVNLRLERVAEVRV